MTLSFRKTRFSYIPKKTDISSLNQEVFIWHWSNPTHGEQTQKLRGTKPPSLQKGAPKNSKLNKMKKTEKYATDEGTWYKPTRPKQLRGIKQSI